MANYTNPDFQRYFDDITAFLARQLSTLLRTLRSGTVKVLTVGKGLNGALNETTVDASGNLNVAFPITAFGELSVAEATPIFQGIFEYTVDNTELVVNTLVASGTVTQADAMAHVGTGATTGSTALLQTKRHARYRSGEGGKAQFTSLFTAPVAGTGQLIGLADEPGSTAAFKNGYMVGYIGTVFGFHRFQNDSVTTIELADWNDPLDGSGPSGMTIDLTSGNVWKLQFQYLGFGAQFLSVENTTTGTFSTVLAAQYANANTTPSVHNPNFRHTIFVGNGVTTSDIILKSASYYYGVEGRTKYQEIHQPQQTTGELQKTSVTTEVPIFTIRNKSTYASKTNFIEALIEALGCSIEAGGANNLGKVRMVRDATLGGSPSWSDINTTDSVMELDTAATSCTGGKTLVTIPLAGKNDRDFINLIPFELILNPGESITAAGESAGSAVINASVLWKELF